MNYAIFFAPLRLGVRSFGNEFAQADALYDVLEPLFIFREKSYHVFYIYEIHGSKLAS